MDHKRGHTSVELDEDGGTSTPAKKAPCSRAPKLLCKIDVGDWIVQDACQCLNESTTHRFPNLFRPLVTGAAKSQDKEGEKEEETEETTADNEKEGDDFLESNVDEQLLLLIKFTPRLKLHEIHLQNVRVFANEPDLSFEDVEDAIPAQTITFAEEDLAKEGNNVLKIPLKLIKFHKVDSVSLFVEDNMGGKEKTRIRRIMFVGDVYEKVMIDLTNEE